MSISTLTNLTNNIPVLLYNDGGASYNHSDHTLLLRCIQCYIHTLVIYCYDHNDLVLMLDTYYVQYYACHFYHKVFTILSYNAYLT